MNTQKRELFLSTYRIQLEQAHREFPEAYAYPTGEIDMVFERMKIAFDRGSYNKDGVAFKRTCKLLGITHTYKAINEFIER